MMYRSTSLYIAIYKYKEAHVTMKLKKGILLDRELALSLRSAPRVQDAPLGAMTPEMAVALQEQILTS